MTSDFSASAHPSVVRYGEHINPAFVKLLGAFGYGRVFVRAKGTRIWDHEGREYLDFLAGFGSVNLGHNPPRLLEKVGEALSDDALNLIHVGPSIHEGDLGAALAALTRSLPMCLLSNSGGEAVEAGLKVARAATKRPGFIYCKGGFHGTGLGTLSVMGSARMRRPFEPLLSGCVEVPFGDLEALDAALAPHKAAAFLVEPIQAEAGVVLSKAGYLKEAQALCKRHGTCLVLDEVQTGLGRTGTMFAYQQEGFEPDILVLGKALGGSLLPISATLTTRALYDRVFGSMDRFDLHGTTYSGNTLACRTALATLALIQEDNLAENSAKLGKTLVDLLRARLSGHPFVREIRGRGLLVGLELGATEPGFLGRLVAPVVDAVSQRVFGQWLAVRLLERGIVAQPASQQWNVLRLEPPLTVTEEEIEQVVEAIGLIMDDYWEMAPLLKDVAKRLGRQYRGGFSF